MSDGNIPFLSDEVLEIGVQGIDIRYVFAVFGLVIAFRQSNAAEMIVFAELSYRRGTIRYDPASLIITIDMKLVFG